MDAQELAPGHRRTSGKTILVTGVTSDIGTETMASSHSASPT